MNALGNPSGSRSIPTRSNPPHPWRGPVQYVPRPLKRNDHGLILARLGLSREAVARIRNRPLDT